MEELRIWWMKQRDDFFDRPDMIFCQQQPEGDSLVLAYNMLLLKTLKTGGHYRFQYLYENVIEQAAAEIRKPVDVVKRMLQIFEKSRGVMVADEEIFFPEAAESMDSMKKSSAEREARRKKQAEKDGNKEPEGQCPDKIRMESVRREDGHETDSIADETDERAEKRSLRGKGYPSRDEVFSYFEAQGLRGDPDRFFDFYDSQNWESKGEAVRSWQMLAFQWSEHEKT